MLEDIFKKVNEFNRRNIKALIVYFIIVIILIIGLVIFIVNYQLPSGRLVAAFSAAVAIGFIFLTAYIIRNGNQAYKIQEQELLPYLIGCVNPDWRLNSTGFNRDEEYHSLMFAHTGTFTSRFRIEGKYRSLLYRFGYVSNMVSTGKSTRCEFCGTYIVLDLPKPVDGLVHIRTSGWPRIYKSRSLTCVKYESDLTKNNPELKFYADRKESGDAYLTPELLQLFVNINSIYRNDVYLTLADGQLMLGLNSVRSMFAFGYFAKLKQETFEKKLNQFKTLDEAIVGICQYAQDYA